ncbi:hypothetical protein Csa_020036 [Cucumis sativus]|uniref:Uncharacterized protein n=1 Tax=Cucumis sativus TaxID=3659 RepID=A0A0A0LV13_CUCSA|nr:hypothetical protein Csa_020036 [Cucumis sativus]
MGSTQYVTAKLASTHPNTTTYSYNIGYLARATSTIPFNPNRRTPIRVKEQVRRHPAVTQSDESYGSR